MTAQTAQVVYSLSDGSKASAQVSVDVQPAPTSSILRFGGSLASDDGGLDLLVGARRVYNGGWVPSTFASDGSAVTASRRTAPGGTVWYSYKGTGSAATLRSFVTSMSDYLEARQQKGLLTYEHEPEIKDVISPAVFHAGYDILEPICEGTNVEPICNQTGFISDRKNKAAGFATYDTYYRPSLARWSCDHYNQGHGQAGEINNPPATVFGNVLEYARSKGKHLLIGETGAGTGCPGRASWYANVHAYILANPDFDLACAFDARDTLLDQASAEAFYGV